eukprot:GHVO01016211.1.p1 GENE.GHVO01016211.1~~GHVO01016211.1.p1  ORF type:complete len:269 (+),score=55.30 GHVO01016211.1:399-1205(+)
MLVLKTLFTHLESQKEIYRHAGILIDAAEALGNPDHIGHLLLESVDRRLIQFRQTPPQDGEEYLLQCSSLCIAAIDAFERPSPPGTSGIAKAIAINLGALIVLQIQLSRGDSPDLIIGLTRDEVSQYIQTCPVFWDALIVSSYYEMKYSWDVHRHWPEALVEQVVKGRDAQYYTDYLSVYAIDLSTMYRIIELLGHDRTFWGHEEATDVNVYPSKESQAGVSVDIGGFESLLQLSMDTDAEVTLAVASQTGYHHIAHECARRMGLLTV